MPKITNTHVEALANAFKETPILSVKDIKAKFPTITSIAGAVWYLRNRLGMVIDQRKNGRKVIEYIFNPTQEGVKIKGSKKAYILSLDKSEISQTTDTQTPSVEAESSLTDLSTPE